MRYEDADQKKRDGVVYTPPALATFIAERLLSWVDPDELARRQSLTIYDPAVGDGALLFALREALEANSSAPSTLCIRGGDIDAEALSLARARFERAPASDSAASTAVVSFKEIDFLASLEDSNAHTFAPDLLIANPPYVRTQVLGAEVVASLRERFGLTGRIDLSHAFLLRALEVLAPGGVAAIITSNRFMTVRAGEKVRAKLRSEATLREILDLGDTKLFDAAVLPVVLIFEKRSPTPDDPIASFTSVYGVEPAVLAEEDPPLVETALEALAYEGGGLLGKRRRERRRQAGCGREGDRCPPPCGPHRCAD